MITKPFLPNWIRLQVVLIVKKQVSLNICLVRLIQKIELIRPRIAINSFGTRRRAQVSIAGCFQLKKTLAKCSLVRNALAKRHAARPRAETNPLSERLHFE